jgi:hypothetical protein
MITLALHTLARSRLGALSCVLVLLVSTSLPIGAQERRREGPHACLDTISAAAFARVPVYLEAQADQSTQALLPAADTFAIHVAAMVRSSLSESTSLPEGETLLRWREVGGSVRVAVHRDGRFTWSTPRRDGEDTLSAPSRLLLVRAVTALREAGAKIGWPPDVAGDSAAFDLVSRWPDVTPTGTMQPLMVRIAAMPMFSMAMPRSKEVVVRRPPRITYPPDAGLGRIEGTVILQFVVDSTGRVVSNTMKDKWPMDRPRITGQFAEHYQAFVNAAKWGLTTARFEPATLGGCPVPQRVEQPFNFSLNR